MAIEKRHDGILFGGRLYTWAELDVTPNAEVRRQVEAAGKTAADAEWESTREDAEAAKKARLEGIEFPGKWITHDGELRFVRGYPNGRYGYWRAGGEFVDLPWSE